MAVQIEAIDGVDPLFAEAMLRQQMANWYKAAVPDLSDDEAVAAATASWETDWPDDPAPRTFEAAKEVVRDDLAYWNED